MKKVYNYKVPLVNQLKTFAKYKNLLFNLTSKEVKLKYRRSYLGMLWSLLNPLLIMVVLTIVFSTLFQRNIPNYPVYLLAGKLVFDFNSSSTKSAMGSIVGNSSLIRKIYVPKYVFPLSQVLSNFVNLFFSLIALVIVMIATSAPFHLALIIFWVPLVYLFVFSCGLGLLLSAINVFFRDTSHLYTVFLTAWTYFTPIFYPEDIIPERFYFILRFNPLKHMVKMFRTIVIDGTFPTIKSNLICASAAITMLIIGIWTFKKLQDRFILYI